MLQIWKFGIPTVETEAAQRSNAEAVRREQHAATTARLWAALTVAGTLEPLDLRLKLEPSRLSRSQLSLADSPGPVGDGSQWGGSLKRGFPTS